MSNGIRKSPRCSSLALFFYCGLALFSFYITSTGASAILNNNHVGADSLLEKKAIYLKNADKFDIIFSGSSYMFRSIKPNVFSERMDVMGYSYDGYNFADAGSYAFEMQHYLNLLTTLPLSRRPDFVFINLFPINLDFILTVTEENRLINRMIRYHDPGTTFLNIQALILTEWEIKDKAMAIYNHMVHLLYNVANVGMGRLIKPYRMSRSDSLWLEENNGYYPAFTADKTHKTGYTADINNNSAKIHEQNFKKLAGNRQPQIARNEISFRRRQYQKLQRYGIRVIYVIPPVLSDMGEMHDLCQTDGFPTCFSMDDPFKYPELYQYENRYDLGHLNDKGADYYSRYIANRFVEYLERSK